jgi:iron complex outermembrane receptor protein
MAKLQPRRLEGETLGTHAAVAAVALVLALPGAASADDQPLQEITVTGSRIALSPGMTSPTPVTAVTQDELLKMAPTNIIDSLNDLPQFFGNSTYQQALGGQTPSGSEINLRGANTSSGISRTLVLLDGRRSVANSRFGAVDIGSFPDTLIRSVEVVTGGASASYGTDAVAGVVNFLLDTKFEGVKAEAQGGITARRDGPNSKFSLTFGHQFGEKVHLIGSIATFDQDAISDFSSLQARPWFNQASRVSGPPGGPTWVVAPYVAPTNFSYNGTISGVPGINGLQFSPDGKSLLPAPTGVLGAVGDSCSCLATANETYSVNSMDEVAGGYRRTNAFLHGTYDVNDKVQVYGQGMYSDDAANIRWQSAALLASWALPVDVNNPFLTTGERTTIQNALIAANPNATGPLSAANGYGPGNRYVYPGKDLLATQYFTDGVYLNNVPGNPLGETRQITENITHQGTLGFKSELPADWKLDGYFNYGATRENYIDNNGTRVDRLFFAADAVDSNATPANPTATGGNPICRVASQAFDPTYYKSFADCVPINLFGGWSNISPQAAAYVSGPQKTAEQYYTLQNGELSANGKLFDGWAGPISAAIGASWRKESILQTTPNPANEYPAFLNGQLIGYTIGTQPLYFRGVIPQGFYINQYGYTQPWPAGAPTVPNAAGTPTGGIPGLYYVPTGFLGDANSSTILFSSERTFSGDTKVKEAFTELNLPLVKDVPFVQALSTDIAGRWADYSGSGNVWAWKVGGDWAINDTIRLRATRSRDVRAASLEERFDTTRGGVTVNNPYVLTNGQPTTQSGASYSGGNPNLLPEKADTWTAGFVLTPTFVPGFSASVDWYNISIADAIDKPTPQQIVNAAFAGDPQYQALVKLDANNNIVEVDQYFINFAQAFVQGVDVETAYRRAIHLLGGGAEDLAVRLYFTDLIKNATLTQFGTYDEWAGQVGTARSLPKQKYTLNMTYDDGPYALFLQGRYLSHGILDHTLVQSSVAIPGVQTINDNEVGGIFYMDVSLTYTVPVAGDLNVYAEVNNVMDRAPPTTAAAYGRTGSAELNPQLYDVIGRRYTLGVRYRF